MTVNPLVAGRIDQPVDAWAGVWIAEDIELIAQGVRNGSWVDGGLGVVGAALDGLALVSDPVGVLLQYGVAWIIEHVKPLSEVLDWLAGDPGQIAGHAQTWRNVATSMKSEADRLARAVRADVGEWGGTAGPAYRAWTAEQEQAITALGRAAETMAVITEGAGMLIAAVRMMVRDAVATCVSRLITYAAEEAFSLGVATPLVVEQITTTVAAWAARIARWLRGLLGSLRTLTGEAHRLGNLIDELKKILNRLRRSAGERGIDRDRARSHGGHTTRPRNRSNYEREQQWAEEAYDAIRATPTDSELIAGHLREAPRLDGSRGFSKDEIERIRQHIFFEEHPLDDYSGGIVRQRYDASPDMAEAWLRLRRGSPLPEDFSLLEHELAESRYYRDHPGSTYQEAHAAANRVSNWQKNIPEPTFEDYAGIGG